MPQSDLGFPVNLSHQSTAQLTWNSKSSDLPRLRRGLVPLAVTIRRRPQSSRNRLELSSTFRWPIPRHS